MLTAFCACVTSILPIQDTKSGISRQNGQQYKLACPSFMCFFSRGNIQGINSSKNVFDVCMYVFFYDHVAWIGFVD